MKNLRQYLAERFPIGITATHAFATSAMLVGIAAQNQPLPSRIWSTLGITTTFFFFMLRMRVTDEFKDRTHDDANYPNRPVQRGIISSPQLIALGVFALTAELFVAFISGYVTGNPTAILWHLFILAFSVLTHFEFFAKTFLERHFNFYFFLHQLIFVLYPIWVFSIWNTEIDAGTLGAAFAFVLYMAAMEIVRKYEIRRNPAGEIVMDTYLGVWRTGAFWALVVISAVGAILLHLFSGNVAHLIIGGITSILMLIARANNEKVRALVAIGFIIQSVVCLAWA
jgi:4-hydroxybenzoate polyprenyltransferase